MATFKQAVLAYLEADSYLSTIVTGGWYDADDLLRDGLNQDNAPGAFDSTTLRLKPTGVLKWTGTYPYGPFNNSQRQYIELYLYQHEGYDKIELIKAYLKKPPATIDGNGNFHRKNWAATDDLAGAYTTWASDLGNYTDDTIANGASVDICRFFVMSTRK